MTLNMKSKKIDKILAILGVIAMFIALMVFSSCMTEKKINKFKEVYCGPAIVIIKDSLIKVPVINPADSTLLELWLECDSCGNVYYSRYNYYEGKWLEAEAKLKDNVIKYVSIYKTKTDTITVQVEKIKEVTKPIEITTNILTSWQSFLVWSGGILWLLFLLWLGVFVAKKFIKK